MSKRLVSWINKNIDFAETYQRMFNKDIRYGKCFCPFHENTDTPAAKYYEESNTIYCFSCQRIYSSYDLLLAYAPDKINEIAQLNDVGDFDEQTKRKRIEPIRVDTFQCSSALDLAERLKIKLARI